MIWFDDEVAVTARHMLVLEPGSRAAIEQFIAGIEAGGSTAAVPALELAYRFDTVGLGIDQDGELLHRLAAESGGVAMMR